MPDDLHDDEFELEVVDDVEWLVDDDGTEYFLQDGVRYELAADGYAYAVDARSARRSEPAPEPEPTPVRPPAGAQPSGARPLASTGPLSAPRPAGDEVVRWPGRDDRVEAPPSPFSRQAAGRPDGAPLDPDRTSEMPVPVIRSDADGGSGNGRAELLRLDGVRSGYGSLPVLHGVEMAVRAGETAVMLGLNGAGKTTTAMNICGALKTWDGTITFDGQDITAWSTKRAVDAGVVMVPEGRRVFPDLSVAKNLQMGAWSQRRDHEWVEEQRERVFGYFPRLRERADQLAGTLSGGEQQMLAIGRGLMARPKLLIIDEASMGLAPVIVADVFDIVGQISRDGTTVLMIEQNVAALDVADVAYVMEQGRMVRELRGDALRDRSQVSEVLMG